MNIDEIVEKSFGGLARPHDCKYQIVAMGLEPSKVISKAEELGYAPEGFKQTFMKLNDAHWRFVKKDHKGFARMTSEKVDNQLLYVFYVPI